MIKLLDGYRKRVEATIPTTFGWSACVAGLICVVMAGFYLLTKGRTFIPNAESPDAYERFIGLWMHYFSIPQEIFGLGCMLFGTGLACRKEWGRQGLLALIRLVFLSLFVLLPAMGYGFFVFMRDKWIPEAGKAGPNGPLFAYGSAVIFGIWAVFVMFVQVWWVMLLAKRLNAQDYRAWTSSSAPDPN